MPAPVLMIRAEQMTVLRDAVSRSFVRRAVRHLRVKLGKFTLAYSDDELEARVRTAIAHARRYGFSVEWDVMRFIDASILLEDQFFDDNPSFKWARSVLDNPYVTTDEKADALLTRALELRSCGREVRPD